ncbi:MAG: acetyl-CoA carboxylase biotin carboxylase subunit [Acidimicrobiaceae bacterium]|nr:acetyl-CoA carboxylase biotin carboxylase subunit [Acidimicrobiaceae bacterium]
MKIKRVFIANRGEIAVRVVRACKALGIESVVAVSIADQDSLAARLADRAVCIGPPRVGESYLNQNALLAAALGTNCDAIHPGYGFLAENPKFVKACEENRIIFVGPSSESVQKMGNKLEAREIAKANGVPVVPGSPRIGRYEEAIEVAEQIGFPILFKAAAGGGGRGIRIVHEPGELEGAFQSASAEAQAAFGDSTLYVERYIVSARHIEIQVFGDKTGNVIHLGERDCSMQRRYQKIIEEAPAAMVPDQTRGKIREAAVALVKGISYENAGTCEFIYDEERDEFYFLEMNARIQVEHPVTEAITGVDLVQLQLRVAGGEAIPYKQSDIKFQGHAIECRINAESPQRSFHPSPGRITLWRPPETEGIRLDTHCYQGYLVPPFYDSLLAKLIVYGKDRSDALERTKVALGQFRIEGIETNTGFLAFLINDQAFESGRYNTRWVEGNIDRFLPV